MIVLQCYKCGQLSYLELEKTELTKKQVLCEACGKQEKKVRTFEMKPPYLGWHRQ